MGTDLVILGIRLLFVLLLYAFLAQVLLVVTRDLRQSSLQNEAQAQSEDAEWACLVVVDGSSDTVIPGQRYNLEPVTSIGRSPNNVITIQDNFISGQHAMLTLRDKQWWIEDLGSANGTYVNRKPVNRPTSVGLGSVIEIGQTRLKLLKQNAR